VAVVPLAFLNLALVEELFTYTVTVSLIVIVSVAVTVLVESIAGESCGGRNDFIGVAAFMLRPFPMTIGGGGDLVDRPKPNPHIANAIAQMIVTNVFIMFTIFYD
jgi:hypothetical protein